MSEDAIKDKPVKKLPKALLVRTVLILALCGVAAFAVLAIRLYEIQIKSNGHYESLALSNQLRQSTLTASRGTIVDRNGKILAVSASVENVFISPYDIDRFDQNVGVIADGLSDILGVPRDIIIDRAARLDSQYEVIKPRIESGEARLVREFIIRESVKGVYLEPATRRYYPNDNLAGQIIGFVGTDNTGLYGLEALYDGYLTGVNGRLIQIKNAQGTVLMLPEYEDHYDAQDGYTVTLTIDSSIQYYVEKHLLQAIEDYDVINGAMCIAMDPRTGAILAMANYPNFDPNNYQALGDREMERLSLITDEDEYNEALRDAQFLQWRNRAIADTYEPGSVFKIITLAMALEENVATANSVFDCRGSIEILGREDPLHCWNRWGHGPQELNQAIQNSCNIACVELGLRLGARTFYRYIDAFGLFDKTGLDSNAEGRSIWWEDRVFFDRYNQSQLASATFGQTFKVTPLQMITAVAATINGGYLMQPYIVQQVADSCGNIIEAAEPTAIRQVISAETSGTMRSMLEDVVRTGTGRNAQVRGYRVGGKTGTSENVEQITVRAENAPKDYIVSFVGFAPADDPQIIILLLLDTPSNGTGINISGGAMAAPIVGNMLADILPLSLGVRPQYTEEELRDINVDMPRVAGRSVANAIELLTEQGFEVTVIGDGETVSAQLPVANAYVASGTAVFLYAGEEAPRDTVTAPPLLGMSYAAARQALESRGLFIRTTGAPRSDERVRVSIQSIPAGTETTYGSVVEVTLIDSAAAERN